MASNLVIVESPAKAKTLERFLGSDYKVMSSYGHIRDLKRNEFSVDTNDFTPLYEIPAEKQKVVDDLKRAARKASTVWLASDEDREGEAISWHLAQVLALSVEQTKRIVFHEITKPAILYAVEHPRHIDVNLVNAQQARRVLDRIVGFKISPVLWRRIKPSLSAGRVQSVAVRLIVEREREIEQFTPKSAFTITATFATKEGISLRAEATQKCPDATAARAFLSACYGLTFRISDITKKPLRRSPAPPFTTSTLQQEAARKLGMTVAQTMAVAQRLYEAGLITYMRTDSVNLSKLCLADSRQQIVEHLGAPYAKTRNYQTHTKGAQEAHEAIRPTSMAVRQIEGRADERRLYELIWKRTIASQMSDAQLEKTTLLIEPLQSTTEGVAFAATAQVITFDGFLKVYRESFDDDSPADDEQTAPIDATLTLDTPLSYTDITATEHFTRHAARYNEASLVHKLEELGIGRPSTYAPTISTIQQRAYVEKGDKPGTPYTYCLLTLSSDKNTIEERTVHDTTPQEHNKLLPTDIGIVVNDFLVEHFPDIVDYAFTANAEKGFDEIALGHQDWQQLIATFYQTLITQCDSVLEQHTPRKAGERFLGNDPDSGRPVSVKIGRYGPVAQIGSADDDEKPRFARLQSGQSIQHITLQEALSLFRLPRTLGQLDGQDISVGTGRFGPFVRQGNLYASLPKDADPYTIDLPQAIDLLQQKRRAEAERHMRQFPEEPDLEILKGRFGPYILYKGSNYRIPKDTDPMALSLQDCLDIIAHQSPTNGKSKAKSAARGKRRKS